MSDVVGGPDVVAALAAFDSCTVSDACDAAGVDGAVRGLAPLWSGARVCGRAVTMRLEEVDPLAPPAVGVHLGVEAIERSAPGDVIVVANGGRRGMGGWGGLLSLAAERAGVAGVVVDGACRDVDEARERAFPVFALGGTSRTARGRVHQVEVGQPVEIAGVRVAPGDVVVADGSGVVVVPAAWEAEVLAQAERIAAREREMVGLIEAGRRPSEVLGGGYETLLGNVSYKS